MYLLDFLGPKELIPNHGMNLNHVVQVMMKSIVSQILEHSTHSQSQARS